MNKFETLKLFYNRYNYKISIKNSLGSIFRDKNLTFARDELDKLQYMHEGKDYPLTILRGLRTINVPFDDFLTAKFLLSEFEKQQDYKLRVENPDLSIYTNNKSWIESLLENRLLNVYGVYYPSPDTTLEKNTIIMDHPFPYEYKVGLKDRVDPTLARWIKNNKDKVKIGPVALRTIEQNGYCRGFYFYVKNDKILQLVNIMINGSIARVDKIISRANIDK